MNNAYRPPSFRPPSFSLFPPVVKNLLILNGLFFLATYVIQSTFHFDLASGLGGVGDAMQDYHWSFGLHYFQSRDFHIYQLITYMFMHGGLMHIGFNMFALWMFGYTLENFWGAKRFIIFYFICGVGAGITQEVTQYIYLHSIQNAISLFSANPDINGFNALVHQYFSLPVSIQPQNKQEMVSFLSQLYQSKMDLTTVIGASGAIFGVLLAFGMLFPNTLLYVYFAIPVKAKYFVIFYGLLELYMGIQNSSGDNVAHFAHLGGMLFGFILIMFWKRKRTLY